MGARERLARPAGTGNVLAGGSTAANRLTSRRSPTRPKGKGRKDIEILSIEELEDLARAAERAHPGPLGQTMHVFVLFLAYSTIRPGEAVALEWRDIDFKRMRIHVRRRSL